jgi:hypothetical protein
MPPMPPPPIGIAGLSFGASATIASVGIDDAGLDHVDVLFGLSIEAQVCDLCSPTLPTTIEPSATAFRRQGGADGLDGLDRQFRQPADVRSRQNQDYSSPREPTFETWRHRIAACGRRAK